MTQILYPSLHLFLYDKRETLGGTEKSIQESKRNFWRKIDPELDKQIEDYILKLQGDLSPNKNLEELEKQCIINELEEELKAINQKVEQLQSNKENSDLDRFELFYQPFEKPLEGSYFALQLGDIYALKLAVSDVTDTTETDKRSDTPRDIDQLSKLKSLLISKLNHHSKNAELDPDKQGTLGQTWFFWGKLTDSSQKPEEVAKEVAKECYEKLKPKDSNWNPNFTQCGEFLGGTLFEYWHVPQNWVLENQFNAENYHLIICLFPADGEPTEKLRKKMQGVYFDLTKLFCYRHKIIWSYHKSRGVVQDLKTRTVKINQLIADLEGLDAGKINLTQMESKLIQDMRSLSDYTVDLTRLETHGHTIAINQENYKKRLTKIETNAKSKLDNLREFSETAEERYRQQIEKDLKILSGGVTLLENLLQTIATVVNIEQTKTDRDLTATVAIASLGLAASGITATVVSAQQPPPKDTFFMRSVAFGYSVGILFLFIGIWLLYRYVFSPKTKN